MADHTLASFSHGTENILNPELIAQDAAQDSLGWLTKEGKIVLTYGRNLQGNDTATTGKVQGIWFGYLTNGTRVMYRKVGTVIQYLKNTLWTDGLLGIQGFAGLSTGLVSYYKLNANSNDSVGSNNGTDTAISYATAGIIGNCATFNGTTSQIAIADTTSLKPANISISLWFKSTSADVSQMLVSKYSSATPKNYYLQIYSGTVYFGLGNGTSFVTIASSASTYNDSNWHHLVATFDGTNLNLYINGISVATPVAMSGSLTYEATSVYFGANNGVGFLTGSLDELAIFSRALSASEIAAIYKMGLNTWTTIITGLTDGVEGTFSNYSSLSGAFTYYGSQDGLWKIVNAFPENPIAMYAAATNFKGRILIDRGRMLLWGRQKDPTGLYGSYIDAQNGTVYTTVTGEATSGSGTLAFKGSHATAHCFGVTITVTSGGEVFTDNYDGTLTGSAGHTGTINYVTGAYVLTTGGGAGTGTYQWEDSNAKGVTDFTHSATRTANQGFQFPQDEGGDSILNVLLGQDGAYYSMKSHSSYVLSLDDTDLAATNLVYRKDIGLQGFRGAISTNKGIAFMNTSNSLKPEMTILQKSIVTNNVEPIILFPQFKFANYLYDDCAIDTWERYVVIFCKTAFASYNDTVLLCDMAANTVDPVSYEGRCTAKDSGNLYVGSGIVQNVYQLFNGFDDLGRPVTNYWISKKDQYQMATGFARSLRYQIGERLKKYRRQKIKGTISNSQTLQVYVDCDGGGFQLVGTVLGTGDYVDYSSPQSIGSNMIGQSQIGGDDVNAAAYPFFTDFKVKLTKFRTRTIKLVATGIGYIDIQFLSDFDILVFETRLPVRFRQKQNVSLDGTQDNIPES